MGAYESQFEQVVRDAFGDLCATYSFSGRRRQQLYVIFENDRVVLTVAQKHIWDQIDIAIGLKGVAEHYGVDAIAAWKGLPPIALQIGDENVLRRLLPRAVEFLCQNADALLRGDRETFAALDSFSRARDVAYGKQFTVEPVLTRAHDAWNARDYGLVVDLLSSVKHDLGPVESRRLHLAAKYLEHELGEGSR